MILNNLYISAQDNIKIAFYGKIFTNFIIDTSKIDKQVSDYIVEEEKRIAFRIPEVEYQLIFTPTESLFSPIDRLSQGNDRSLDVAILVADGNGIKYTNLQTTEKLIQKEAFGKMYLITTKTDDQKWDLINETKKIGQFNCFKATTIRTTRNPAGTFKKPIVAWYTTEVPFPHGPIGYGSLPGLIVELSYENATYFLKKIDLKPTITYKIEKPTKGKKMTMDEYYDMQNEAAKTATFN